MRRWYAEDAVSQKYEEMEFLKGWYFATAGFSVAWWVSEVDILRLGSGGGVEVYEPLGRWWRV